MTNGTGSDIIAHFRTGLDVIKRYPIMAMPPIAAQAVMLVLTVLFFGGAVTAVVVGGLAGMMAAGAGGFLLMLIGGLLSLIASGVTVLMARDALAGGPPSLGDAFAAVMARLGDVVFASVLVTVIVVVGMIFLVLPGVVAGFFLMFTLPAVLLDGRNAVDGLARSATLVKDNLGVAAGLVVGIIVAVIVVTIVFKILGLVPILGHLAVAVLTGVFIAYLTVVAVRVYQALPRR